MNMNLKCWNLSKSKTIKNHCQLRCVATMSEKADEDIETWEHKQQGLQSDYTLNFERPGPSTGAEETEVVLLDGKTKESWHLTEAMHDPPTQILIHTHTHSQCFFPITPTPAHTHAQTHTVIQSFGWSPEKLCRFVECVGKKTLQEMQQLLRISMATGRSAGHSMMHAVREKRDLNAGHKPRGTEPAGSQK